MKTCVVHNTLNSVGGGERVCLAIIEALKSLGHEVYLVTAEPTNWARVKRIMGDVIKPDKEIYLLPFRVRVFGIYMRLLTFLELIKKAKFCDLIVNTHGDVLPISSDIIYMHYPTFALLKETPINVKYSKSLFWRIYFCPYEEIQSYLIKKMKWRLLLTNSRFSQEAIKRYIGADAIVIYPPVEISEYLKVSGNTKRDNRVVLCGRYTPEKNYEVALKVASLLPDVEFTIIGASSGKISTSYFAKLQLMKNRLRLKNVRLLKDVSRKDQIEIYSTSKVFMHCMRGEHFGIAVVEGMAAGLIPVVHKSGGPWSDITDYGKYGFGYSVVEEAANAIERALNNYDNLRGKIIQRAMIFQKKNFLKKFKDIIRTLY